MFDVCGLWFVVAIAFQVAVAVAVADVIVVCCLLFAAT